MPRIRQNAERDALKDLVGEINAQCSRYGFRTQEALGKGIGVCQGTAGGYLHSPERIPLNKLRALVQLLRLDPIIVLKAVGYSSSEIRKFRAGGITSYDLRNCDGPDQ